jgi:predicted transport protein
MRYRKYGEDILLFELVNATTAQLETGEVSKPGTGKQAYKTIDEYLAQSDENLKARFEALKTFSFSLGDDVQLSTLKYYYAFKRIRNFACIEVHPQSRKLLVFVKADPSTITLENGFTRDVKNIGHYGTGDLEISISSDEDVEKAKPLLIRSYEAS